MKFSVIVPALNEEKSILACLSALQPYRGFCEIIVVDGGSQDNTKHIAKPLADKVISSERGRACQMNAGAEEAEGEMLVFLHADTYLPDNAFGEIEQALTSNRQWGRFDILLTGRHPMLKIIARLMNWRSRLTGIATGDQVIFAAKALFVAAGRYPCIALMEDIAICKTLKKYSAPICLNSKVISSGRRWEKFGVFKTILLMWSLRLRFFFGADPQLLALLYSKGRFWKT